MSFLIIVEFKIRMIFFHAWNTEAAILGNFKAALFPKLKVNGCQSFFPGPIHFDCLAKKSLDIFLCVPFKNSFVL